MAPTTHVGVFLLTTIAADETRLDGQATQTDAVTEPASEPSELDRMASFLAEEGVTQDDAAQNPEPEETESDATTTEEEDDPEIEAAVQARAERLAEEKAEQVRTEERQRQEAERAAAVAANQWRGVEESFRTRAPRIRSHLEQVRAGEVELNIDGVLNEFASHHAQVANVRDAEWHDFLYKQTIAALPEPEQQRLAGMKARGELPVAKLLEERDKALSGKAKEGLHPESRLKEEHTKGALSYRTRLEKMLKDQGPDAVIALLQSRGKPPASRNSQTSTSSRIDVDSASGAAEFLRREGISIGR